MSSITEVNYYIDSGEICDSTWNSFNFNSDQHGFYIVEKFSDLRYSFSSTNGQSYLVESSLNQPSSVLSKFPQPENDSRDETYSLELSVCEVKPLGHSIGRQTNTIVEVSKQKGMIRTVADVVRRRDITPNEHIPSEQWETAEEAKIALDSWAYNMHLGGGHFSLNWIAGL